MIRAAVVASAGAPYSVEEREPPVPGPHEVRIRVHACGYCLSDENIRDGKAGAEFPRVPGHEAAGVIEAFGEGVQGFELGERVGVGWHGGHCLHCDPCREGDFRRCQNRKGCGSSYDGGFAECFVAPATALARIPDEMSFEDAGPIMCGGITVWNALRKSGASWGDTVAIQGVGGLGHLAIQFARAMGFHTVAITTHPGKADDALKMGAHVVVPADEASAFLARHPAKAILCTAPSGKSMAPLLSGLGPDGRMVVVGVSGEQIAFPAYELLGNDKGLQGSVIGTPRDVEKCLQFAQLTGVKPWTQVYALDDIQQASDDLRAGKMRYRAVISMRP